jgi:hypothetical protein
MGNAEESLDRLLMAPQVVPGIPKAFNYESVTRPPFMPHEHESEPWRAFAVKKNSWKDSRILERKAF